MKDKLLTTFYIVRHGENDFNQRQLLQGQIDASLTERGETQAKRLATHLKDIEFTRVFSSDLVRAKRTAEIVALEQGLAVTATSILRERAYGVFEGTKVDEFHDLYVEWDKLSHEQRWTHQFIDEETFEQVLTRFITFIRVTAVAYPGEKILFVAHSSLMRSLLIHLGYGTWETIGGFINCGYIHLESDGVDFFVKSTRGVQHWRDVQKTLNQQ